jgi:hypothetical protein
MNINANTNMNSTGTNGLLKFMTALIDKYGSDAIDWTGYLLGLNKNGKPVTKQTNEELSENFKLLAVKLKDPKVLNSLVEVVKETEPILQEVVFSVLHIVLSTGKYLVKDVITIACSTTPLAPICGLFKLADNTIVFGQELVNTGSSTLKTITESQKVGQKLFNKLNDNANEYLDDKYSYPNINPINNKPNINPIINKPNTIQKGGIKKIYKDKKDTENRINKSLHEFMNLNKKNNKNKTRRIKKK